MTRSLATARSGRSHVAPFYVMEMLEAAERLRASGRQVFNLAAGQPGTGAPSAVLSAAQTALTGHRLGYTDSLGVPALRQAIAAHVTRSYGIDCRSANVVVTTGSSGGFLLSFLAAFDAGDPIALARPGYPAYRNILQSLGNPIVEFDCGPAHGFHPSAALLDALPSEVRGLVLASPANPTGAMVAPDQLAEIVAWCRERDVVLISDEIYHGICYREVAASAWQFSTEGIVVNSFSKYFSMTGWRLGWLLVPDHLLDAVAHLASNYSICPPTLSQFAALAAFDAYPELDANVARYRANRELVLDALTAAGLTAFAPADGAFYVYADVSAHTTNSLEWVKSLLQETGVAIAPGRDFDPVNGDSYVRLSFAGDTVELTAALDALTGYLNP